MKSIRVFIAAVAAFGVSLTVVPSEAIPLNESETINVGLRAYANVRIGTNSKQSTRLENPNSFGGTFVYSPSWKVIQNRYFVDVQWDHDLLPMFDDILPKWVSTLDYTLNYRGEYEGIYDFGPSQYSRAEETQNNLLAFLRQSPTYEPAQEAQLGDMTYFVRHRLRQVGSYRNRLFQAFADVELGDFFLRVGRQNLVWGETDVFRLLDNINPVDNSFGGFFIDLDERRVPLNMLRASYYIGSLGPFEQAFLEGYATYDNSVAWNPGAPEGSPWSLPLGPYTGRILRILHAPSAGDVRGGGRAVFNWEDFTFTLASYFTMLDTQTVRFRGAQPDDAGYQPNGVSLIAADLTANRVWINGAAMTTAVPELMSVLRSEIAWFRDEPLFRGPTPNAFPGTESTTDPNYLTNFLLPVLGGDFDTVSRKDTLNFVVGWDMNQYIRFLNDQQSFFFTTQFFWKHIFDYDACSYGVPCQSVPVPQPNNSTRTINLVEDQFLHTLRIDTTYRTTIPFTDTTVQATPSFGMFYDWQGMFVFQPGVRFVRDPWRFIVDYTNVNSGVFRATFGAVRDRDNIRFQLEYVL